MFPLVARLWTCARKSLYFEASVDISKLSKLNPSAVICEVMNEDDRMATQRSSKIFKNIKLK